MSASADMDRWLSPSRKKLLARKGATDRAIATYFARTEDHVEVALSSYTSSPSRNYPVVLCHGLGANRFSYDLAPELSFAKWLADAGFDVYTLELRGHGRSQKAGQGSLRYGWGLFDYAWRDLPAAIEAIFDRTGHRQLHFVGHSMGGIAALARLASGESRVRSLITLASAMDYSGTPSVFHGVRKLLPLSKLMPAVPLGPLSTAFSSVALAVPNAVDAANVNYRNVDRARYRLLTAVGFHPVSSPVLAELATCFDPGGLRDGERRYAQALPATTPTIAIAGTADIQCSPEAAARHAHSMQAFGRAHGQTEDYGHFDLMMGVRARLEVWPVLHDWLVRHD